MKRATIGLLMLLSLLLGGSNAFAQDRGTHGNRGGGGRATARSTFRGSSSRSFRAPSRSFRTRTPSRSTTPSRSFRSSTPSRAFGTRSTFPSRARSTSSWRSTARTRTPSRTTTPSRSFRTPSSTVRRPTLSTTTDTARARSRGFVQRPSTRTNRTATTRTPSRGFYRDTAATPSRAGSTTRRSPLGRTGFATRSPTRSLDEARARTGARSPRPGTTARLGTTPDRARFGARTGRDGAAGRAGLHTDRDRVAGRAGVRTGRDRVAGRAGARTFQSTSRHRHGYHSPSNSRYGYYRNARARYPSHRDYRGSYYCHDYYRRHHWYLSFYFGYGSYFGVRYYYPYYDYLCGSSFAFFYPGYISYAYVPFGFYCDAPAVYIDRSTYIREEYPVYKYEVVDDEPEAAPTPDSQEAEPEPAAESPMAEKLLREASDAFRAADYEEAARKFRLAAIAAPDSAGPLFALGQALIAIGQDDAYAARVIRKAVRLNADLVREPGDISGVYKDQEEFARVMAELAKRAEAGGDAYFLLGVNRYLTGDPAARGIFASIVERNPDDDVAALFADNVAKRFKAADELPPIK